MAMTEGITAAMNSCCTLPFELFSGAASTMWDLDPSIATPDYVAALIKSFFSMGGQIFQGNMTDVEELKKALEAPESYKHLIVRVGGYSARFVNLKKELQTEIIERMRHKR
jgi:formate C-acetyltransferase